MATGKTIDHSPMQCAGQMPPDILLITAPFFSYHISIIRELESRGLCVEWWNDRISENTIYKICLRLLPRIVTRLSAPVFSRRLAKLEVSSLTKVLVIKGEGLPRHALATLKAAKPEARFHLYLWDSVQNTRNSGMIAPIFDSIHTFDPIDAHRYGWHHRPLFASPATSRSVANEWEWENDWAFIGSVHSDRVKIIKRLRRMNNGLKSYVYGFIPGKTLWWLRHLFSWSLWKKEGINLSTKVLAPEHVKKILSKARSILDIEHPNQRGLTMRTIETLLSNQKLITTNPRIRDTDLFDETRVCIIERARPKIPDAFFQHEFRPLSTELQYKYSIKGWLDEILSSE